MKSRFLKFLTVLLGLAAFLLITSCATPPSARDQIKNGEIRDYVGLINQVYHPEVVAFLEDLREGESENSEISQVVTQLLRGGTGSGFVYVDTDGTNYVITNHHVIAQCGSLAITFEKLDGSKRSYDLSILMADDDIDIAILTFTSGERPFADGLVLAAQDAPEGQEVWSAGFPGLESITQWQLGWGTVSNARAWLPGDNGDLTGPYVRHGAQIDHGNSGGPLLVKTPGVPSGYTVVGINTLKYSSVEGANFAIPMEKVNSFVNIALGRTQVDQRAKLEQRVAGFVEGLNTSRSVYQHIADYLTDGCTALNGQYGFQESINNITGIANYFMQDPVAAMNISVGQSIENALKANARSLQAGLKSIEQNNSNSYTVVLTVNGKDVQTEWFREYGIWRLNYLEGMTIMPGEPNETREQATPLPLNISIKAAFDSNADVDWYRIDLPSDGRLTIYTGGDQDTKIYLFNQRGTLIADDDDAGDGSNARLNSLLVPQGPIYVRVEEYSHNRGVYTLHTQFSDSAREPVVTVTNSTGKRIYFLQASPSSSTGWGPDLMDSNEYLYPGDTKQITLSSTGDWDFMVLDGNQGNADTNTYVKMRVNIRGDTRIEFTTADIYVSESSSPTVSIVNNTGYTVWYIYASPSTSSQWGSDRLEDSEVLRNGASKNIVLSNTDTWDFRLIDEDGDSYVKTNVNVRGNMDVVFIITDIDFNY